MITNWRNLITDALSKHGESIADVQSSTMTADDWSFGFDDGLGGCAKDLVKPFLLWTEKRVYFSHLSDGAVFVESVPRHPNGLPAEFIGADF